LHFSDGSAENFEDFSDSLCNLAHFLHQHCYFMFDIFRLTLPAFLVLAEGQQYLVVVPLGEVASAALLGFAGEGEELILFG
jgi:hypothetical protein